MVAGSSGTRSEFNGDWAWSDYVLPQGYAYASQNKGVLNLFFTSLGSATPPDASSCRLNPVSELWVHFYDNDLPGRPKPFTQWTRYMLESAALAQKAAKANYHRFPRRTYAVGTSNGGYQVRRAMEVAPDLFDGGVDWEGTFIGARENILVTLPPAIENFDAYVASGYDPNSAAAKAIEAAGYPPDIVVPGDSLWSEYWGDFWEVTQCQWQKRFDPNWVTYTDGVGDVTGTGTYDYYARLFANPSILPQIRAVETTGRIKRPVITVAGTMDALLPIKRQARAYEDRVLESRKHDRDDHHAPYRLYEVQNGNHIEAYTLLFPQLQLIQPHAQKAFDLLVDYVEHDRKLPPSQCIPKGSSIKHHPAQPGRCAELLAP
ncbi:MAG TPA: 3-hydroxybutyrate oligomer hydrolase family protein [Terriglobales bacterium]|nr:3-hydroxybutyrate oligomer hydrolase family protein [Terriglobales bacterium]